MFVDVQLPRLVALNLIIPMLHTNLHWLPAGLDLVKQLACSFDQDGVLWEHRHFGCGPPSSATLKKSWMHPSISIGRLASAMGHNSIVSSCYVCWPLSCLLCMKPGWRDLFVFVFGFCSLVLNCQRQVDWLSELCSVGQHPQMPKNGQSTDRTNSDRAMKSSLAIWLHFLSQWHFVHSLTSCVVVLSAVG